VLETVQEMPEDAWGPYFWEMAKAALDMQQMSIAALAISETDPKSRSAAHDVRS